MDETRYVHGTPSQYSAPVWKPLDDLVGERLASWFMWMGEVRLDDGTRVQMYKHSWTRRYIHLTDDRRTFFYAGDDTYEQAPLDIVVGQAFIGDYPGVQEVWEELDARLRAVAGAS